MKRAVLIIFFCSACYSLFAQETKDSTDNIGSIKVKKRPPAPLPAGYVDPGFIRPCGYRGAPVREKFEMIAGLEYFRYTYLKLGVQTAGTHTNAGLNLESNIEHRIYGFTLFAQYNIPVLGIVTLSPGVEGSSYLTKASPFQTAGPYLAAQVEQRYIRNFQLSYSYNFIFGDIHATTNAEKGSLKSMNTHSFTLMYRIPL